MKYSGEKVYTSTRKVYTRKYTCTHTLIDIYTFQLYGFYKILQEARDLPKTLNMVITGSSRDKNKLEKNHHH